ncbi:MAG TPA: hypothetical protein ENG03_04450 [Thioploca sp.]|nr:MAG: hypothetical protein DRR08_09285 [Gammaproteobacteria bacterium]HDN26338.1 hypothetical protein [Thioploca sp.]
MKKFFTRTILLAVSSLPVMAETTPEKDIGKKDAVPGECYAQVLVPPKLETKRVLLREPTRTVVVPAQYKWVTLRIMVGGPSERIEIIPAQYEWVDERVMVKSGHQQVTPAQYKWVDERIMVKEPGERIETIPAQYKWVDKRIMVKEPSERIEVVPARCEWADKKVLEKPATPVWGKDTGLFTKIDETGEIICLVEALATDKSITKPARSEPATTVAISPARYKIVRTGVIKRPATTRTIKIPAVYKTVRTRVIKRPATTRTIKIPGQYKTLRKRVMVRPAQCIDVPPEYKTVRKRVLNSPAQTRTVPIPAKYKTILVKVLVAPAKTREVSEPATYETVQIPVGDSFRELRSVLCETQMTPSNIRSLQTALRETGLYTSPVDGVLSQQTLDAVEKYQRKYHLLRGSITIETLEKLGVKITP